MPALLAVCISLGLCSCAPAATSIVLGPLPPCPTFGCDALGEPRFADHSNPRLIETAPRAPVPIPNGHFNGWAWAPQRNRA